MSKSTSMKAFSLTSASFSSSTDWWFSFIYSAFNTSLALEGSSQGVWTTLWAANSGVGGTRWLAADVLVSATVVSLRFLGTSWALNSHVAIDDLHPKLVSL